MGSKCCKEGFKFVLEVNNVPLEPPFGFLPDFLSNAFCESLSWLWLPAWLGPGIASF